MTQLDLIRKKRDEAINQLNQQKSNAENEFYGQRNNVDTEMMQELAMQKDALARSGWSQGGENLGAMMKVSGNRGAKLMSLRNKQLEYNQGIDNKITDTNLQANEEELQLQEQEAKARAALSRARRAKATNPTQNNLMGEAYDALDYYMKNGNADKDFLAPNAQQLIQDLGVEGYKRLIKEKQMRERELRGVM